jgi:outer membrane receptor for ferrienterochelin and colicins
MRITLLIKLLHARHPCALALFSALLLSGWAAAAQSGQSGSQADTWLLRGYLSDAADGQALVGASVYLPGTSTGTSSDARGYFELPLPQPKAQVVISMVGYRSDTLLADARKTLRTSLQLGAGLPALEVEARREAASLLEPINQVTISRDELNRAACCNLSESFETNLDVDMQFSDGVSGARQVRMLGLDGRYVQLLSEGRPGVRGLALPYGLTAIPGPWLSAIQITKGPGSVVNGYEAISGQLNVEYHQPKSADKLFLNGYGSLMGRAEANAYGSTDVGERSATAWFGHGSWVGRQNDHNRDGFLDLPTGQTWVLMNRWSIEGEGALKGQVGAEYTHQDILGGQLNSAETDINSVYSNPVAVRRAQVWARGGWSNPDNPRRSSGLTAQATWHEQNSRYGNRHEYRGEQRTLYLNQVNDLPLGSSGNHLLRSGASLLVDDLSEQLADPLNPSVPREGELWERTELVPGVFAEYTFEQGDWSVVAGARLDYHNLAGWIGTPRLHLRRCWNEQTTLRLSGGRGFRTVNPVLEFSQWLNSSRALLRDPGLLQESAWNTGGSLVQSFKLGQRSWAFRVDYFYTAFEDRVVADLDSDAGSLVIRQSEAFSRSHAAQAELDGELSKDFSLRLAWKYEDVRAETAGQLRREVFVPFWRGLVSLGYQTCDKRWQADATLQLTGPQRLPLDFAGQRSPVFPQVLAQVSRRFERWTVYAGTENLTGFHQHDAIRGASNPFGPDFDAAGLWGPVMGRNVYAGFKYTIPQTN